MKMIPALDAALAKQTDSAISMLQEWLKIPSLRADRSADNAPFGAQVRRMLDKAIADINSLGITARDIDGYACDAQIGEGDDPIGILAHLDVVPEGTGWELDGEPIDPYGALIKNGRLYGRGTSDDKGPAVAALFAMKAVLDAELELKRPVRLILGCDEESGMEDMDYYKEKIGLPDTGFSPDANFPVINTEKGILQMEAEGALDGASGEYVLLSIASGTRPNVVPNTAVAKLSADFETLSNAVKEASEKLSIKSECVHDGEDILLTVRGVSAHASTPWDGDNAASALIRLLAQVGVGGSKMCTLRDAVAMSSDGEGLGIAGSDKVSGPLTLNLGLLSYDGATLSVTLDCRYPVFFSDKQIVHFASQCFERINFVLDPGHASHPHHVSESSFLVKQLLDVYASVTGFDAHTVAIGGGTYARCMKEAVAFGSLFPDEEELAHQANENIDLERFEMTIKVFAYAIAALCC